MVARTILNNRRIMAAPIDMLQKLAEQRKTIRTFTSEKVDFHAILAILEIARQAPSGSNRQPWRFLIIDEPAIKTRVREAAETGEKQFYATIDEDRRRTFAAMGNSWQKPMFEQASVLLAILGDTKAPNYRPSVWLAVGYILLALEAVGLQTVTYTPSDPGIIGKALQLPNDFSVETILPLGYAAKPITKKPRTPLKELTYYNHWGTPLPPLD